MRRNLIAVAATFACLAAFPVVANAASVQALGTITGPVLFSVNAVSTPATGTFGSVFFISQNNNTFQIRGTVACMTVSGNEAYVVYRDTLPRPDGAGGYI